VEPVRMNTPLRWTSEVASEVMKDEYPDYPSNIPLNLAVASFVTPL
jgi:hypothetical protein